MGNVLDADSLLVCQDRILCYNDIVGENIPDNQDSYLIILVFCFHSLDQNRSLDFISFCHPWRKYSIVRTGRKSFHSRRFFYCWNQRKKQARLFGKRKMIDQLKFFPLILQINRFVYLHTLGWILPENQESKFILVRHFHRLVSVLEVVRHLLVLETCISVPLLDTFFFMMSKRKNEIRCRSTLRICIVSSS